MREPQHRRGVDPMVIAVNALGFAFGASWTVVTAMAVHLPRLLEATGASTVQAVAAGTLIGPSQVEPAFWKRA